MPILFPDITYSFYPVYAGLWNIPFQCVPLKDDFSIDPDGYKVRSGGAAFPNPNAPTGRSLPIEDVVAIAENKSGQVVIVDEAYTAFALPAGRLSAVPYIERCPNILTVHTLSKAASLAGLRVGFAIAGEELIEGLCRVRDSFNSYTLDRLALAGAVAAVRDGAYYDEVNRRITVTRERVSAALAGMGFDVVPSDANFIFVRPPHVKGAAFFVRLRERGILVRHFDKPRIADFLRVSIGTDSEMDTFLEACRDAAF
jgi:histidinol-phosphate aminotransferase